MNDKSRKWQRLNLFIVNFSHITSFYSILPMIPYLNMELGLDGIFYSLTFSGYYLTQLFSLLFFGSVSDRLGRRWTLLIAMAGLCICSLVCFTTKQIYIYIIMRCVTGVFDCVIPITQAYITDISTERERSTSLAHLEAVMNAGQCFGPFISGAISIYSIRYSIYFGIVCEAFGFFYALFFLPETIDVKVERLHLRKAFKSSKQPPRSGLVEQLMPENSIAMNNVNNQIVQQLQPKQNDNEKLEVNYLIVTAIICEFCNKFIYSSFDTLVCQYGSDRYALSSFQFSLISTLGSAVNIFQTGCLFQWLIDRRGISIPSIGCLAGLVGAVACILCVAGQHALYFVGSTLIIVGYGFYSPVAPTILTTESNDRNRGKALSMSQMGGQLAYVVSPVILEQLYGQQGDLPFVVTLIPAFVLFVVMLMCNYLPGGKLAGQVSLADTREHEVKLGMMNADNELETEFLGADGRVANKNEMYPSKGTVRPIPAMIPSNEMELEAATLPESIRFSAPNNDTLPESIHA
ncbi:hypothetical protein WA588_003163 [Blastocystis sp. NMH]